MPFPRGEKLRFPFRLLACAAGLLPLTAPLAVSAQTAPAHVAPKLLQRGTNAAATAGPGDVTIQVFVKKDGSFTVTKVIKSSNPADNAAALEIAKTSKYKPATNGGAPVDEYYDFTFSFNGDTAAIGNGPLAAALATIRAGKYDQAKTDLQAYLQTHPGDAQANLLVGVADSFGGDPAGAVAGFDKAGTIPPEYKVLARQSYDKYASQALNDKHYPEAVAAAGHAIDLDAQSLNDYYVRGIAYIGMQNYTAAIADLQKARAVAQAAKADDKTLSAIAFNLAVAQLDAGQFGEAATTARDVARTDTAASARLDKTAYVVAVETAIPLANAGHNADAVSRLESGAAAFPNSAAALYAQASVILATDKKPDWDKVKAEADKALALDPKEGRAEYILGIVASRKNDVKATLDYLNKAKASPTYSSDPALAKQVDDALNKLNSAAKSQSSSGSPSY
jgi:cytochrome c-type biogenesis protein CcmH/NrfG